MATKAEALEGLHKGQKWRHDSWEPHNWIAYNEYGILIFSNGRPYEMGLHTNEGWERWVEPVVLMTFVEAIAAAGPFGEIKHQPTGFEVSCASRDLVFCQSAILPPTIYELHVAKDWVVITP